MMERRQIWLEDQFLKQERDLLRLSREINVLQDFITLHFDSFRDYSFERERSARRLDEANLVRTHPLYPSGIQDIHGLNGHGEIEDVNSRSSPVDLSTTWRYSDQTQSPSPVLSRGTLNLQKDLNSTDKTKDFEWAEEESQNSENEIAECPSSTLMTYGHGGSVSTFLHPTLPQSQISISPGPRLVSQSPYDSVLGRILRSEPNQSAHSLNINIKREMSPMVSTSTCTTTAEGTKLHWSCGTVTTTTTNPIAKSSLYNPDHYDHDDPSESSDDNQYKSSDDLYSFTSSLQVNLSPSKNPMTVPIDEIPVSSHANSKSQGKRRPRSTKKPESAKKPKTKNAKSTKSRRKKSNFSPLDSDHHHDHPHHLCSSSSSSTTATDSSGQQGQGQGYPQGGKKCRFCGKTFQWSHSVKTHERLHTGDKPYVCKMCGTRFTQNGNLKVHAKTCVGKYADLYKSKNIFVCPLCTDMFQSMDALMEHQRSHDRMQWSDKEKTCRICGQVFQKRSLLLSHEMVHVQVKHGEDEGQDQGHGYVVSDESDEDEKFEKEQNYQDNQGNPGDSFVPII